MDVLCVVGIVVLFVIYDVEEVLESVDQLVLMDVGWIIQYGVFQDVWFNFVSEIVVCLVGDVQVCVMIVSQGRVVLLIGSVVFEFDDNIFVIVFVWLQGIGLIIEGMLNVIWIIYLGLICVVLMEVEDGFSWMV